MTKKYKNNDNFTSTTGENGSISARFDAICTHFFDGKVGEFAKYCGIDSTNLSKIINGSMQPNIDTRRVLVKMPQISARWLMFGTGTMLEAGVNQQINGDVNAPAIAGNGNTSESLQSALDLLKTKDEQLNRLITVIERLTTERSAQ